MSADEDTIVAIATPPGRGGIGIVRVSGSRALEIGRTLAGRRLTPRVAHHALFRDGAGALLDDGLVIAFEGPRSFTGEDVVEFQGHGGPVVLQGVVSACLALGARHARPGEFTERAFLNDRLDLVQAEAIADLIDAGSEAAARGALKSLEGEFSRRIRALVDELTAVRVYAEAALDFPEEEVDFLADGAIRERIDALRAALWTLQGDAHQGALLTRGLSMVIAGAPNAGKSSLMNALSRRDTAIVTHLPGTTRDLLREAIDLDGLPLHVVDTAGLRETTDPIEAEGVRRARDEIARADVLLFMVDASVETDVPSREQIERSVAAPLPRQTLVVRNKIDLPGVASEPSAGTDDLARVSISAKTGAGIDHLVSWLKASIGFDGAEHAFSARSRHVAAIARAVAALDDGLEVLAGSGAGDLLAEDLRRAQEALGEILGEVSSDELLGRIFSSFCIGK
ncbi:MAG: tRNA uridine-5-carboxymethylaminomethyl(34) synthesis GTPase MnmE [Pseudomonadales bacterium]|jgi:tRNA modification GTPase|nr:tRNA uridine-5-carboxymethylaminomethyl(34) synthesis GTPase MnmE [Pseudomonadales bacterium]